MHALHAILVELEDVHDDIKPSEYKSLKNLARSQAKELLDQFGNGEVWDWYEDGAGRWSQWYPDNVILGAENKEKFLEQLRSCKGIPYFTMIQTLRSLHLQKAGWRTKEQIEADGVIEIYNEDNDPEGKMFSGILLPDMVLDEKTVIELYNSGPFSMKTYYLRKLADLIDGKYIFDSQFYSLPDECTKLSMETQGDCEKNPHKYALVFFDLHN